MSTPSQHHTRPPAAVSVEDLARAWHTFSDHAATGTPFGDPACDGLSIAPRLRSLLGWFDDTLKEPEGLGAVVTNPVTGKVYVRDTHPAVPWHKPEDEADEQWSDPTCEDWFTWANLPRPLIIQTPGWTPPTPPRPRRFVAEPTGLGAVIADTLDETWVRAHNGTRPWVKVNPDDLAVEHATTWAELDQPVAILTYGWQPPRTH